MIEPYYVLNDLDNVDLSPIAPRVCACGCGHTFQPKRHDQLNINKKHADRGYHEKVRKPKQKNQNIIEKHLRANNRICEKYFISQKSIEAIFTLESLKADGFNTSYFYGTAFIGKDEYYLTYNYAIHFFKENEIEKVKISKQ